MKLWFLRKQNKILRDGKWERTLTGQPGSPDLQFAPERTEDTEGTWPGNQKGSCPSCVCASHGPPGLTTNDFPKTNSTRTHDTKLQATPKAPPEEKTGRLQAIGTSEFTRSRLLTVSPGSPWFQAVERSGS